MLEKLWSECLEANFNWSKVVSVDNLDKVIECTGENIPVCMTQEDYVEVFEC